jgi:hypothetical protein
MCTRAYGSVCRCMAQHGIWVGTRRRVFFVGFFLADVQAMDEV